MHRSTFQSATFDVSASSPLQKPQSIPVVRVQAAHLSGTTRLNMRDRLTAMRRGWQLTKSAACDGVIKLPDAGACVDQIQVVLGLQTLEQVSMLLEDGTQGAR